MKTLLFTILTLSSAFAFSAQCPSQSLKVINCLSTPATGDNEVVSDMFDSIAICQAADKTLMVFQDATSSDATEVKVTTRAGGIDYVMPDKDVQATLSVDSKGQSQQNIKALFILKLTDGEPAMSTYMCGK